MPVTTVLGSNADVAKEVIESGACPLLAQSGHHAAEFQCLLFGGKADMIQSCSDVCF